MADNKRKERPSGSQGGPAPKRSKGSKAGKWKTTHQESKASDRVEMGKALDVGDQGIWVTFARGMKSKAIREVTELCEEYGESMYGLARQLEGDEGQDDEDEGPVDIEASIKQELDKMKPAEPKSRKVFSIIPADVDCILFVKTMAPVDPVEFVRKICLDARDCADVMKRKTKYINRLTPVSAMDKATENGITRVARAAMAPYFHLVEEEGAEASSEPTAEAEEDGPKYAYAIRQTIRNHMTFKSDAVIKKVADLVQPVHKVKLTNPDKVVLVEIYQLFCGVSVVDGVEWESLKRYNMNELYRLAAEKDKDASKTEAAPASA